MKEDDNRIDKTYSVTLSSRVMLLYNYLLCYPVFNYCELILVFGGHEKSLENLLLSISKL